MTLPTKPPSSTDLHPGFLTAEDAAMKDKVSGLKLNQAQRGLMDVPVRFRYPEAERNPVGDNTRKSGVTYPLITVDLISISYDMKRDHVNNVYIWQETNENYAFDGGMPGITEYPLPVRLLYRVTTWTRSQQDDRALQGQMLSPKRLPLRHGYLYIPVDNTIRWMESMPVTPSPMIDDQERRIFRHIYSNYVESEMLKTDIANYHRITSVILDPPVHVPDSFIGVN